MFSLMNILKKGIKLLLDLRLSQANFINKIAFLAEDGQLIHTENSP